MTRTCKLLASTCVREWNILLKASCDLGISVPVHIRAWVVLGQCSSSGALWAPSSHKLGALENPFQSFEGKAQHLWFMEVAHRGVEQSLGAMASSMCSSAAIQKLEGRVLSRSSSTEKLGQPAELPSILTDMIFSGAEPGKIWRQNSSRLVFSAVPLRGNSPCLALCALPSIS